MKRIILIISILSNIYTGLFAQTELFYYGDNGKKETFKIRKDKMILHTKTETDAKSLSKETLFQSAYNVNHTWVIATIDTMQEKHDNLRQRADIVDATHAFEYADGTIQMVTDQIFIESKEGISMEKLFNEIGLSKTIEKIEMFDSWSNVYLITLNVKLEKILNICQNLFESGLCKSASPVMIER